MTKETPEGSRRVPIAFQFPANPTTSYATNFIVQHTRHEFIVSFFEAQPPVLLGTSEERQLELERVGAVPAYCVARITLSPARMRQLIDLMKGNYERYEQMIRASRDEENEDDE